jgi:hypothetical protein
VKRPAAWGAAALVVVVAAAAIVVATGGETRQRLTDRAGRVLVISLPHTAWEDLEVRGLPNLDQLMSESAIASLTTRTVGRRDLSAGYLTLGAGARASAANSATDGAAFGVREQYGRDTAGAVFARRTGTDVTHGIVHLGLSEIIDTNEDEDLGAVIGALGDALRRGGISRALIANGDGGTPVSAFPEYQRHAVSALMSSAGRVPAGRVDAGLLTDDDDAPFGRRLDVGEAVAAFENVWTDRSVVLVEASDLVRAARYQAFALKGWRRILYKQALRESDRLVGRLLEHVDPSRDAVVVVSPSPSTLGNTLSALAVRAPGVEPGLLRSPSLSRAGFAQIVDVAPMILDLVGVTRPSEIRGRPPTVVLSNQTGAERRAFLVDESEAAQFRDAVVDPVIITFIVLQAALALGAVLVLTGRLGAIGRARVRFGALALLAFVPTVYLARVAPFHEAKPAYPLFLLAVSLALAFAYERFGRRHELDAPIIALAVVVGVLVGDVVLGARLQLDSAFGYTPTVGVRISGFGNISYAALAASAVLLAGLCAHRIGGGRGLRVAVAVLAVAFVADSAPFWGADVGGVLSMIPAFGITAVLLSGRRVRPKLRTALICLAAVLVGLALATALDLSRAEEDRTHLGRFIEQVRDEGSSRITDTVLHKLSQNLATITSIWGLMLPGVFAFLAYLSFASKHLATTFRRLPELRAAMIGFVILAVLGYVLNDSGINIPAMMLAILNATLVTVVVAQRRGTRSSTTKSSGGSAKRTSRARATR